MGCWDPAVVELPIIHRSPWRQWPWVVTVLLVAVWLLRSWLRPSRPPVRAEAAPTSAPRGRAELVILTRGAEGAGWHGVVIDAHDGSPLPDAEVQVQVPSFVPLPPAAATVTDTAGRFALPPLERPPDGTRLVVTAPWHTTFEAALPLPGALSVRLVTRRRALLERFAVWARAMGRPWAVPHDPTPAGVKQVAVLRRDEDVASWAQAVEVAAFGPDPVDAAREAEVVRREPPRPPARGPR